MRRVASSFRVFYISIIVRKGTCYRCSLERGLAGRSLEQARLAEYAQWGPLATTTKRKLKMSFWLSKAFPLFLEHDCKPLQRD